MTKTVFVLLLWFGGDRGGPAVIDNFPDRASCEKFAERLVSKQESGVLFRSLKGFEPIYGRHCEEKEIAN